MNAFLKSTRNFLRDEEGAQVIEYALIIAVVSIALVLGLQGLNGQFGDFITRVGDCLTGGTCTAGGGATPPATP